MTDQKILIIYILVVKDNLSKLAVVVSLETKRIASENLKNLLANNCPCI